MTAIQSAERRAGILQRAIGYGTARVYGGGDAGGLFAAIPGRADRLIVIGGWDDPPDEYRVIPVATGLNPGDDPAGGDSARWRELGAFPVPFPPRDGWDDPAAVERLASAVRGVAALIDARAL